MSEKTELPTPKRLREAREKGQVAKSKDFTQALLTVAIFGYTISQGPQIAHAMSELMLAPVAFLNAPFKLALEALGEKLLQGGAAILLPYLLIVIVVAIFGEMMQTGVLFAWEALKPNANKLDVVANIKNMFGAKGWIELGKSVLKLVALCAAVMVVFRGGINDALNVPHADIGAAGWMMIDMVKEVILYATAAYVVIAAADFIWVRKQHTKELMMSMDEVKREYKEMEGDPHIKGKRKQLHKELLASSNADRARKATVVVTNPTHLAVALFYDEKETPLPMLLAKGEGWEAEQIVAAAKEAGVPIMQNVPLARSLTEQGHLDQFIPSDLIEPVAEVLRAVRALADQRESTTGVGGHGDW